MAKQNQRIKIKNFRIMLSGRDRKFICKMISRVLKSSRWTSGPVAEEFENEFKKYTQAPYAIAVSDGGAALVSIIQALGIPENSIIICPALTAPPTPHAILKAGMRVIFVDSMPDDLGVSLEEIEIKLRKYKGKIGAVIAVHVGGWISPRLYELGKLCERYGVFLIEDCAHAHGSFLNSRHAGSVGQAAAYSFFMTKSLTCGEGGMVTSVNKKVIERIKVIRNYGKDVLGRHIANGFNYKFSEFNAAVALWAVKNASRIIGARRRLALQYDQLLAGIPGVSSFNVPECRCGYYKYIIVLENEIGRDEFRKTLLQNYGIESAGGVYDTPCHQEPYFKSVSDRVINAADNFPAAEEFSKRHLCLPLYPGLKIAEQEYIAAKIRIIITKKGKD